MMKIKSFLICFVIVLFSCTKENRVVLIDSGTTNYILWTQQTNTQESAKEIQKYLAKATGTTVPITKNAPAKKMKYIRLFVDNEMQPQEIGYKMDSVSNVHIYAGSLLGLKYASYTFLERELGCLWLTANEEYVPKIKTFALPKKLHYQYQPKITTRTVHSRLFYKHPEFATKHRVTTVAFPKYVPTARVHTFHRFMPEETFYKKHPEYFALRGKKRLPTQLCLTNDKVRQIVKDSITAYFERYPEATVLSLSQDDNQQYCECKNCATIDEKEDSHSGTMIRFVNAIAADFKDKTISTLAYQHTRKPPKITAPAPNVLITLCSIECDRSGSIANKCKKFTADLKGWSQLTKNIRIWDYTTQFTNFLAPFPNLHTLQPNIKLFTKNNAKWIFEQHSNNPSELFELRSYLTAKLLWNPERNYWEIIEEFVKGYYGKASQPILTYINTIHQKITKEHPDFFLFLYGDPSQAFNSYLSADNLRLYMRLFDAASEAVQKNDVLSNRVAKARLGVDFAFLEACKKNLSDDFSILQNREGKKIINPILKEKLERFKKTCEKNNIRLMNEMGFTVERYYNQYQKTIQRSMMPNKALNKKVTLLTKPHKYADENPQVLTDGALGGNNFYANWLGFEGNHLKAVIDLGSEQTIQTIQTAFLKVTNHVVFYPTEVVYAVAGADKKFGVVSIIRNDEPLTKKTSVNDIKYFEANFTPIKARYIKIDAINMLKPPYWHHAAGLPSWIFADEIIVN